MTVRREGAAIAHAVCLFVCVLAGCSSGAVTRSYEFGSSKLEQPSSSGRVSIDENNPVIKPGDQVQVSVWGYPEFNSTSTVKETGTIVVPLLGEIQAARLTRQEFSTQLTARLKEYVKEDPEITVSIVSLTGLRVSVIGAVTRQDNYPIMADVSLVEVLSSAGGATAEADLRHVRIYRNGLIRNAIEVDLPRYMARGNMTAIPKVRPGDTVFIPRQENLVRDLSEFVRDVLVIFGFFRLVN